MKRKYFFSLFAFFAFFAVPFGFANAENIDPQNAGYKYAKFLDDDSQISFDCDNCSVTVTSSEITGYAWSENFGWVNLQPDNSGVVNDGNGSLSGYAWGETTGWINFDPSQGGVSINSEGEFDGHAWSENYGWIQFDCDVAGACVKTSWAPSSGGGGSSGSSGSAASNNNNPPPVFGCTNPFADNFNPSATANDGSCVVSIDDQSPSEPSNNQDDNGLGDFLSDIFGLGENSPNPDMVPSEENPFPNEDNNPEQTNENTQNNNNTSGGESSDLLDQITNTGQGLMESRPTITRENAPGVAATVLLLMTAATIPVRKLADAPSRAIQLLASAFTRKKKNWGVVFDAITKQPLDPVVVAIKDFTGKVIQTSITDMEGRFGFIVTPGTYTI